MQMWVTFISGRDYVGLDIMDARGGDRDESGSLDMS